MLSCSPRFESVISTAFGRLLVPIEGSPPGMVLLHRCPVRGVTKSIKSTYRTSGSSNTSSAFVFGFPLLLLCLNRRIYICMFILSQKQLRKLKSAEIVPFNSWTIPSSENIHANFREGFLYVLSAQLQDTLLCTGGDSKHFSLTDKSC